MTTLRSIVRWSTSATLAMCAAALSGCIAIPVPLALADPEPFTAESMTSIRIGETTRDDVRALLADWHYETDDGIQTAHLEPQVSEEGRYWVYTLPHERADVLWAGVYLLPEVSLPVPVPFVEGKGGNIEDFWAVFEFNDDATVARVRFAGDKTRCAVGGACVHGDRIQIVADEAADLAARASTTSSDRCVVYAYASDDFDLPVVVADDDRTGWLFEKTTFVRFDVAPGAALPSVSYENVTGFGVTMPIDCAGGQVHYVALRPHDGVIEAVPQEPSVGARAIKGRYVVERLVPARTSHASQEAPRIWTNCTATDPCPEPVALDAPASALDVAIEDEEGAFAFAQPVDHLLLRPGVYTVRSGGRVRGVPVERRDTFEMKAGHRYEMRYWYVSCPVAPTDRQAWAELCPGWSAWLDALWFEDAATKRVVAGDKWCTGDADCPQSQCAAQSGAPPTCEIPELKCTYDEGCVLR